MARLLCRLMLLVALGTTLVAQAASIGEIDVSSHLGEPLRARVPINLDADMLPGSDCVRLVGPARHHPDLADADVNLINSGGRQFVSIRTSVPVNDPVIDLTLRSSGCGPSMQKDFVILLSPKDLPALPAPTDSAQTVSPATLEPAVVANKIITPPPPRKRPKTARTGVAKATPAHAGPARKTPRHFVFRLDYDDTAFGAVAETIARKNQAAYLANNRGPGPRSGADSMRAQAQSTTPTTGPANSAATPGDRLVLQPPPDDLAGSGPGPTNGQDGAAGQPMTGAPAGQGASAAASRQNGTGAGPAVGPAQQAPGKAWYAWLLNPYNLILPLILIVLALLVALLLKRRRPKSRFLDKTASELSSMLPPDTEELEAHPFMARELPPILPAVPDPMPVQDAAPNRANFEDLLDVRPKAPVIEPMAFHPAPRQSILNDGLSVQQADSFDQVMELAEVMLAFGRSGQAIDALRQHIRDNPRQSLDPWLKLLDLYYQADQRIEFQALADDLHKVYNIAIIEWKDYAPGSGGGSPGTPLSLESLPHVLNRVSENWGTETGLDYINKLLEDNRGGQRLGFPMPIVRDMLLLRDILRQICPAPALSH